MTVVPARTVPKSIVPEVMSQPPSLVSVASSAMGAVVALPVNRTFLLPPVVQNSKRLWKKPTLSDWNFTGTVMLWPGLINEPTAGRFVEVKLSPMMLVVPCLVIL